MPGEILHKDSCIEKTPIVKIGIFLFSLQFRVKKTANPLVFCRLICYNTSISFLSMEDICL